MKQAVAAARPQARVDGFTVQPMAQRPHARELIVGASVDAVFGPVILFGQGGTAVEVLADRAIALPPLNRSLARELVSRTRVARLLEGWREHPPVQMEALCDVLIAVSQLLAEQPLLAELDINPLWADEAGVLALDARIRVAREPVSGARRFAILPYPDEWVRRLDWRGRHVTMRPIRPEDEAQHLLFLQRIEPEDIRMRIFQTRRELPRSELARLTQIDYDREMAFIVEALDAQGEPETLGVGRTVCDPDQVEAEFALLVRSDLKSRGLGSLLLQLLIEHARSRGIARLVGVILRENGAMLQLAHAMGFVDDGSEPMASDTRRVVLALSKARSAASSG